MIRRLQLSALCALCALLGLAAIGAPLAAARKTPKRAPKVTTKSPLTRGARYLALGDSVTFGYEEATTTPPPDYKNAASLPGYPELVGRQLHVKVSNAACPGETSGSLIDVKTPSFGCENAYRKFFPLHVAYKGSQLGYALKFLRAHREVRLVSLMVGANDLFRCQQATADGCLSPSEQKPVLAQITRNVHHILSAVRNKAHYRGQIAIQQYYSLNYGSTLISSQSQTLNRAQNAGAKPFHVVHTQSYQAFRTASVKYAKSPCLAGLITQLNAKVGSCGVHPTYSGQALLAGALIGAIRL